MGIIQVANIHQLMKKYKDSSQQQKDERTRKPALFRGIKINLA